MLIILRFGSRLKGLGTAVLHTFSYDASWNAVRCILVLMHARLIGYFGRPGWFVRLRRGQCDRVSSAIRLSRIISETKLKSNKCCVAVIPTTWAIQLDGNSIHVTNQSFMHQWQFSNTADSALSTRLVRKSPLYLNIFARSEAETRKRVCKAPALTRHRSCRPHGRLFFHTLLIRRVAHISERLVLAQADLCRQARNALRVRVITVGEIALEKQLLQL